MIAIVSGEKGAGKSTVCRALIRLARSAGASCGGVITSRAPEGSLIAEDVQTGARELLASLTPGPNGPSTERYFFSAAGIDFSNHAIAQAQDSDILFVDELGWLELRNEGFSTAVDIISAGRAKNAVLVIRRELLDKFLPRLGGSPAVFHVTAGNRTRLPDQIWSSLSAGLSLDKAGFLSGILLAAGESRRFGSPKLLLPANGRTVLEGSLDALLSARLDEIIVVLGDKAEEAAVYIGKRPVRTVFNRDYRKGLGTSIARGIKEADNRASAFLIAFADQPRVSPEVIGRLIGEYRKGNRGIVVPVHGGRRGHPVIFSARYREELSRLSGDAGGKGILGQHPGDILEVAVESAGVVFDIDTPEDYQRYLVKEVE